jgi:hypothetical protein
MSLSRRSVLVWLVGIAALSTALRVALVTEVHGPFIFMDELGYQRLAQSLAQSGHLALFDNEGLSYSPLYSVVLAPIYALGASATAAYHWIKVVNAILMSLSVFPIYGIARFVLPRRTSIVAAALSALAPLMYYTGLAMSENLAYPLFLVAIWTMLVAVRDPRPRNDALLLVSILLATAARIQLIVLFPAAVTAVVLTGLVRPESSGEDRAWFLVRSLRQHWLLVGSGAFAVIAAVLRALAGGGVLSLAGRYAAVGNNGLPNPLRVLEFAVQHLAGLDLAVGVVPFAGSLVAAYAFVRYPCRRDSLAFASVAIGATSWLLLEVGFDRAIFSGGNDLPRIHERYLFYLVPLFLVALFAAVRVTRAKASFRVYLVAAAVTMLLPVVIPFAEVINNTIVADSFGLQLFGETAGAKIVPIAHPTLSAISFAGTFALIYVLVRHRGRAVVVLLVVVFVLMSSLIRARFISAAAGSTKAGLPAHRDWVDRTSPTGDVVLVGGVGALRIALWETAFYNLSISRVYYTCLPGFGAEFGERQITVDRAGRLRDSSGHVSARYAVVPVTFGLRGRVLARNPRGGLVLVAPLGGQLTVPTGKRDVAGCRPSA